MTARVGQLGQGSSGTKVLGQVSEDRAASDGKRTGHPGEVSSDRADEKGWPG
jgi:hypothetical protein